MLVDNAECGTIEDAPGGQWAEVKCKGKVGGSLKIQGAPKKYLHFCGLKVWVTRPGEKDEEEEEYSSSDEEETVEGGERKKQ